jgi:hypothetical protein
MVVIAIFSPCVKQAFCQKIELKPRVQGAMSEKIGIVLIPTYPSGLTFELVLKHHPELKLE